MQKDKFHLLTNWIRDYYLDVLIIFLPVLFGLGQLTITDEALKLLSRNKEISDDSTAQYVWRVIGLITMAITFIAYIPVVIAHTKRQKRVSQ